MIPELNIEIVPLIVIICYCIAEILKLLPVFKADKVKSTIPIICIIAGIILGCILFIASGPSAFSDNATLEGAMTSGGISGLASTGCHQIYKQLEVLLNFSKKEE